MWPQLACQDVHYNDICNLLGSREAVEEGWEDGGTMKARGWGLVSGGWQQSGWPRIFPPPGEVYADDVLSKGLSSTNHMVIWGWNIERWGHELPWAVCRVSGKRNILSFSFFLARLRYLICWCFYLTHFGDWQSWYPNADNIKCILKWCPCFFTLLL